MDDRGLWQSVLGEIEMGVTSAIFSTWFSSTHILSNEDGHLVIGVPNLFTIGYLKKNYHQRIKDALVKANHNPKSIDYKLAPLSSKPKATATATAPSPKAAPAQTKQAQISLTASAHAVPNTLNTKYTFENFVVGDSNDFAYAAAQAVAKSPGTKYNPIFMYGGVGLGKTHLMQAIGNEIYRNDNSKRIQYATIESFTNEFIDSIQKKKNSAFTDKYRNVDVLIIDDMQFLVGKEKTQDEFFHTFNALHQSNKQIIISSDKPPKQLVMLEDRLISRFEMGITVDIQPPDLEMRSAILQTKATAQGMMLPLDVIDWLARYAQSNVRELEGVLSKVLAAYEHRGPNLDLPSIQRLLSADGQSRPKLKPITPKTIIERVASYFDIQPTDITGTKRDREIVLPRQIAMYLMRHDLDLSFPKIASSVGGRDHTTAMHSVTKIEKAIESDEQIRGDLQALRSKFAV